ncbi:MAG: YncE family protein [Terriglobales bacterium]
MKFALRAWLFIAVLSLTASAVAGGPGYHVIKSFKLGGEGGWDYLTLDSNSRLLYISRGTHVIVLNVDSGTVEGDIPDTPGVHGIALAPDLGRGFVSNGQEGTVTIFDLKSLKLIAKVKVGENPDAILYDASTKRVFTFNGRSHDSSAIDATNGTVLATIKLDGKPEFAVSDGKGMIFDNIEDKSELTAIDAKTLQVKSTWPLAPCEGPSGLAIDRKNHRLFSGCHNELMTVVNADNGKVITTLPIGKGVDATRFDPGTDLAFASCGDGYLTVLKEESPDKFSAVENVSTQEGARTLALDLKSHTIYLVTAKFGPPPAPTPERPHPWHSIVPDTFTVLVVGK